MKKDNNTRKMIVGVALFLILIIGATYAYFAVGTVNNFGTSTIGASAEDVGYVILNNSKAYLGLNITEDYMGKAKNDIRYYATDDGTPSKAANIVNIGTATATGNGYFNCHYTLSVTASGTNNLYTAFQGMSGKSAGQIVLTINDTTYDFNTASLFPISYSGTMNGVTDGMPGYIQASMYIVNKNNVIQDAIAEKDIRLEFTVSDFTCDIVESPVRYWSKVIGGRVTDLDIPQYAMVDTYAFYGSQGEWNSLSDCRSEVGSYGTCRLLYASGDTYDIDIYNVKYMDDGDLVWAPIPDMTSTECEDLLATIPAEEVAAMQAFCAKKHSVGDTIENDIYTADFVEGNYVSIAECEEDYASYPGGECRIKIHEGDLINGLKNYQDLNQTAFIKSNVSEDIRANDAYSYVINEDIYIGQEECVISVYDNDKTGLCKKIIDEGDPFPSDIYQIQYSVWQIKQTYSGNEIHYSSEYSQESDCQNNTQYYDQSTNPTCEYRTIGKERFTDNTTCTSVLNNRYSYYASVSCVKVINSGTNATDEIYTREIKEGSYDSLLACQNGSSSLSGGSCTLIGHSGDSYIKVEDNELCAIFGSEVICVGPNKWSDRASIQSQIQNLGGSCSLNDYQLYCTISNPWNYLYLYPSGNAQSNNCYLNANGSAYCGYYN